MLTSVQYDSDQKQGYELGSGLSGLLVPDECDVQLVGSNLISENTSSEFMTSCQTLCDMI